MKERPRLTGIINQVTILFLISILAVGLFTYYTQNLIADSTVRKHTENLAEEVAAEVKKAVEEYPAHLWLLNYWYEHWDQMDVEYDVEFQTGTLTEKKCRLLESRCSDLMLKYASTEEIEALSEENQKLYAEITYSWLITRINQIKRTHNTDYLFCVSTDNTYKEQFFLFSAAEPDSVRGTEYEQAYTLGTKVKVADSQRKAMYNSYQNYKYLTDAGKYVDYYSYLTRIDGRILLIGMTYNLENIKNNIHFQTIHGTFLAMLYQVCLSAVCLMLIVYFVIGPLRKVQKNIRLYKDTKDSASVIKNLSTINSRNEIGQLATDTIDLAKEIKDYTDQIETITAEKERIVTELSLAKRIQEAMLPNDFPAFPDRDDFDIYASMDPAKEVGGDFYDFLMIDEDHLYIAIADVSGKGVPAALFMMASRIVLANNAMMRKNPARILEDTNESICRHNKEEMFITVWLGILELSTGILTAANAGHEYPVIMQKGGRFEMLKDKHGFVVGGMENMKYDNYEIRMTRGTKLFLHTDGLTEATNEDQEMFGEARVIASLNTVSGRSPKQILKKVTSDIDNFVKEAEQFDDLTMLCLEYRGPEDPENQGLSESSLESEGQG